MRLISHKLLEGQNSEELMAFSRVEGTSLSLALNLKLKPNPPSPWLLVHFHGGGFVAQTSKSHENYLKSWSQELTVPILSVDYSLAPEAPFPRALEECFYAYCWALKHCHLLGTTAERVCLAGDSAGGNLCITVAMRAASQGVRVPDGIMVAYPATLLTTYASPSRLLTLIDPMLPLSVLSKCLSAYAGTEAQTSEEGKGKDSSSTAAPGNGTPQSQTTQDQPLHMEEYPDGFQPLRTEQLTDTKMESSPVNRNPYVSPLLAPDSMLKSLPPVHIVACALDAMLDDSVMFARRLKGLNQPVTLCVVEDLPHGFLSLLQLCKETQEASDICVAKIREVFKQGQERTDEDAGSATGGTGQETERSNGAWTRNTDGEELAAGDGQSR
ncbi:hypothetical protein AGOR_G00035450 [Albula goreensis]|uniref:Alpha/beta hydrolase fold-3 domain-containing protein n=1 Tax=Albula goreensis TaxID=1534307 RepID=A0A8T3E3S9_9TELE|nr:hypothetical protein AGOR_G00035450 [Albula goreensis]